MPIFTEKEKTYDELKKYVGQGYTCADCGASVTLCWGGSFGFECHILRCSKDVGHKEISKSHQLPISQNSDMVRYTNVGNKQRRQLMEKHGEEKGRALIHYQGVTSLARNQAMEILEAIWPEAPEPEKIRAALLCATQGLNPLMKHVFLIPFNKGKKNESWATVIGINAKRLMASRRGAFSYVDDTPRIMTDDEQIKRFGKAKENKLVVIVKLQDPATGATAVGYGDWPMLKPDTVWDDQNKRYKNVFKEGKQVFAPNDPYGTDKGNDMFNMATIRAESQALSRLRPGDTPEGIVAMDESFAEVASQQGIQDENTIEGEAREVSEDEPEERTLTETIEPKAKKPKPQAKTVVAELEPEEKQEAPPEPSGRVLHPKESESKDNPSQEAWEGLAAKLNAARDNGMIDGSNVVSKLRELGSKVMNNKPKEMYASLSEDGKVAFKDWADEL